MRRQTGHSKRFTAAAICVVAGWVALVLPWGESLRLFSYELAFLLRKPVRPEGAVILYMDDDSHVKLNADTNWFGPWNRSQHTDLIQKLTPLRPKAIVFDILFDARSSPDTDARFVDAILSNGRGVTAAKVSPDVHEGKIIGLKLRKPFDSRIQWGVAETAGEDKMVRQDFRDSASGAPSLAIKVADVTGTKLPKDPTAPRWITYYGPPGAIPFHSYYEAISNQLSSAEISNKVVFVGGKYNIAWTGGKGTDDFRTPYTRSSGLKSPGVEVVATTYLNLLRGDWLVEIPRWAELLILALTGGLIGWSVAAARPGKAVVTGLLLF